MVSFIGTGVHCVEIADLGFERVDGRVLAVGDWDALVLDVMDKVHQIPMVALYMACGCNLMIANLGREGCTVH